MAATPGTLEHRVVRLTPKAALVVVGTLVGLVLARRIFVAAHRPLSWAAAAAIAAALLDPVVGALSRYIRRVPAVILTFVLARVFAEGTLMREDLEGTV